MATPTSVSRPPSPFYASLEPTEIALNIVDINLSSRQSILLLLLCRMARTIGLGLRRCGPLLPTESVGRSVTLVSPAKTAEGIEMPFVSGLIQMGQRNHVLSRGSVLK